MILVVKLFRSVDGLELDTKSKEGAMIRERAARVRALGPLCQCIVENPPFPSGTL